MVDRLPDNHAPLPDSLPGEFSVLAYDPESEEYTLLVDDGHESTFDLGIDLMKIVPLAHKWFGELDGERWVDVAKEFRVAQIIHQPDPGEYRRRVIPITPPARETSLAERMQDVQPDQNQFVQL